MFNVSIIGNLGADAQVINSNGKEYIQFRVAHTDKIKKSDGGVQETTIWASCFIVGYSNLLQYLKKGTKVYCTGNARLDVYSSKKTHRMEAGLTINVIQLELCGGKQEDVFPSELISQYGEVFDIKKIHYIDVKGKEGEIYRDKKGEEYMIDNDGRVYKAVAQEAQGQTEVNQDQIF